MILATIISLVCLLWAIVVGLCMKLIDNKYQVRRSRAKGLYDFAKKNDLSPNSLRELYDICFNE